MRRLPGVRERWMHTLGGFHVAALFLLHVPPLAAYSDSRRAQAPPGPLDLREDTTRAMRQPRLLALAMLGFSLSLAAPLPATGPLYEHSEPARMTRKLTRG